MEPKPAAAASPGEAALPNSTSGAEG